MSSSTAQQPVPATTTKQRPFFRAVSVLVGGTAASQVLLLIATPLLTRLYPVSAFGYFQIYSSILTASLTVVALRYEMALVLPSDETTGFNVKAVALGSVVLVSVFTAVLVAVLTVAGFARSVAGDFAPWLWSIPCGLFAGGLLQVETYWALRGQGFRQIAKSKFTQFSSQVALQAGCGLSMATASSLLGGDIVGRLASGCFMLLTTGRDWLRRFQTKVNVVTMVAVAKRYKEFPLISSGSGLLNTAGFAIPPLILGHYYGIQVLGLFSVVDRLMGAPVLLIGQAVSQVYMAQGGKLLSENPAALYSLFVRTFRKLLLLATVPAILVLLFAPKVLTVLLGAKWLEAGIYAQLLVGRLVVAFAVWPLTQTLLLIERQKAQFIWDAARASSTIAVVALCGVLHQSARVAVLSYSTTMVVGYLSYWLLSKNLLRNLKPEISTSEEVAAAGGYL